MRVPSAIRIAQIEFMKRKDEVDEVNTAIGNVTLPIHPAMKERMFNLNAANSPFQGGVVKYTSTVGREETVRAFLNVVAASGFSTEKLYVQVTDGGSMAIELALLGVCGPPGSDKRPLLVIDSVYANYSLMAQRLGRKIVSVSRQLNEDGTFSLPDFTDIEHTILEHDPGALLVIPYDNPTGQFTDQETMCILATLCVKHNMWFISDEAYRETQYSAETPTSIWGVTENEVSGIEGKHISIESASKLWNACGLRIGALVTDSREFHEKSVAEYILNLCPNAIGQYIFGALAHVNQEGLKNWFKEQREYYRPLLSAVRRGLHELLPGIIVSNPEASIYSVIDVRNIAKPGFDAEDFITFCSREGKVNINGKDTTLLVAPMAGFYSTRYSESTPWKTQMRIAYVEPPDRMNTVPLLFSDLFRQYESRRR
jgi:aspartate aminotransferase